MRVHLRPVDQWGIPQPRARRREKGRERKSQPVSMPALPHP